MADRKEYVVGIVMDEARTKVVLLRKNRPAWQVGKLNGPGGLIESRRNERPLDAMVREWAEEVEGHAIFYWELVAELICEHATVYFYRAFDTAAVNAARTRTDEAVEVVDLADVGKLPVVANMRWLIPLAADPCVTLPLVLIDAPSAERRLSVARQEGR